MVANYIFFHILNIKNFEALKMITIIVHNSSLSLISSKKCNINHNAIKNDALRRKKNISSILLDIAVHQAAIYPEFLPFSGRPDLIHQILLIYHHNMKLLQSDMIRLIIHTGDDLWFTVPKEWRVPVSYIRYRGLMEQFLSEHFIKISPTLQLKINSGSLEDIIASLNPREVIELTSNGEKINFGSFISNHKLNNEIEHSVFLIGGFQKGFKDLDLRGNYSIQNSKLFEQPTTAWIVLSYILQSYLVEKEKKEK